MTGKVIPRSLSVAANVTDKEPVGLSSRASGGLLQAGRKRDAVRQMTSSRHRKNVGWKKDRSTVGQITSRRWRQNRTLLLVIRSSLRQLARRLAGLRRGSSGRFGILAGSRGVREEEERFVVLKTVTTLFG